MSEELSKSFLSYYSKISNKEFSLLSFERIFGGASRETYKISVKDSLDSEERLILRISQESSLIETEQRIEYLAYSAFQKSNVPVPVLIDMSEDDSTFNAPFMLMRELKGEAANPFTPNSYSPYEHDIGIQFWSILGEITKKKIDETINRILESRSTWESSESKLDFPGFAKINLTASYEGKEIMNEHEFDFYAAENSNLIAPGVAENIKGISKNEKKKFTLTLPLDWKEEDLQGKNVKFEVECLDIQEKVTPKLSDEFLKEINPEIKGIKDFQDQIKKEITAENDYKYNLDLETQIIDDLIKLSKFQISEIQIQRSADLIIEDRMRSISQYRMEFDDYLKAINKSREEFYQESLESSEKELQKLLIIEEVIKLENINANKKDIDDEIKIIKEQYKDQNLADDESLKKIVENNIKRRKSVEHLINVAKSSSKNRKK